MGRLPGDGYKFAVSAAGNEVVFSGTACELLAGRNHIGLEGGRDRGTEEERETV